MRNIFRDRAAFLNCSKRTILLIIIVAITSVTISTTISVMLSRTGNLTVPSIGTIKTIDTKVYWDPNGENKTETIDWNDIYLGTSKNVTVYIKSVSNEEITLNLKATDWNPAKMAEYTTLSWSYNGAPLNPGEIIQVTLTLSFSSSPSFAEYLVEDNVLNYTFDIHILPS